MGTPLHTFAAPEEKRLASPTEQPTERPEAKVLLVGDFPPPHGGVAVHVELLQMAIRRAGGQADVLDIGKGQVPADGVHPAGGYGSFAGQLASFAARGFQIHLHTSGANPKSWMLASACAAAGRISGKPSFITLHSGLGPEWLEGSAARRTVAQLVLKQFGLVIAVSDPIARTARGLGVVEEKLLIAPAFSAAWLEAGELPAAAAGLREEASPLICAMLAHGQVYGAEYLLPAFAKVLSERHSARLVVFGPSTRPHELAPLIDRLAPTAGKQICGLGELGRPQALAVIRASDVFVRPTLADGDSVSVREALALGRMVVCTSVGTRPAGVLLVPPGDVDGLFAGLMAAIARLDTGELAAPPEDTNLMSLLLPRYGLIAPEQAGRGAERAA